MTKNLIILPAALLIGLALFFSCNKESQKERITEAEENSFSIEEAQSWFINHSAQQSNSGLSRASSQKISSFYPQWNKAKTTSDKNYEIVECSLKFDRNPGITISMQGEDTNNNAHGIIRLLVLKNKKNGTIRSALMYIYSSSGQDDSTITYSNRGNHFSGYIFFTDISGEFINGWQYEDGKIIKKGKTITVSDNSAMKALPPGDGDGMTCHTVITDWYERDCVEYYNGDYQCGPWTYMYSTYQEYCEPTGGGGDGGYGGDDPPPSTQDPCTEAKALADLATNLSKNSSYITAKSNIQSAAADGNEHYVIFGKDANGNITASPMSNVGTTGGNINVDWPGGFADLHNHPDYVVPSPGDFYGLVDLNNSHTDWNTRFVVTPDGSVYALVVVDLAKAVAWVAQNPKNQVQGSPPDFPVLIGDDLAEARSYLIHIEGLDELIADEMAMSLVLDKYDTGVALLKQDSNGDFKRLRTESNTINGNTVYAANNCQ
jgi:hypothetical protein